MSKGRGVGRPFAKGRSGNLSGRPAGWAEFQQLCRTKAVSAIERIEATARGAADPALRHAADRYLVDRGYGKPTANVEIAGSVDVEHLHFVVRDPGRIETAAAWEAAFRPAIDVEALPAPAPPPDPEPLPENPPVPGNARPGPHALEGSPLDRPLDLRDPAWRPDWWADRTAAEAPREAEAGGFERFVEEEAPGRFVRRVRAVKAGEL